ncbi:MAG: LysR family transcriptional regulator [Chloroflexota bacterium]
MKLSQLEAFLAIIDTGSFSEAADHLGLSQSAISRALIKLETELDTKLVERHWDGAKPTDIGTEIALHARSTLKQIEIIQQKTAKRKGITKGKLNLGIALGITPRVFTSLIREFQKTQAQSLDT